MSPSIPAGRRHLYLVPPLHDGPVPLAPTWPPPPPPLPAEFGLSRAGSEVAVSITHGAWSHAARVLGTDYSRPAFRLALRFLRRGQRVVDKARPHTWVASIVWVLAEDDAIIGLDCLTPRRLADELSVGLPTLRAKVPLLRAVVGYSAPRVHVDDV